MSEETPNNNSPRFALTRVLVELGKNNLETALPLLEQAMKCDDKTLRWAALHELIDIGKTHPEPIVKLLEHAMGAEDHSLNKKSRVLVDLGKKSLDDIIPVFRQAIKSKNSDLQWMSLLELTSLANEHPDKVIPLFEEALEINNLHLQWMIALELLELGKKYPKQVTPILTKISKMPSRIKSFSKKNSSLGSPESLEKALRSDDVNLQWMATLETTELAAQNPSEAIPLFEIALKSEHTSIHWLVMVELVKLVKIYPRIIAPFLTRLMEGDVLREKRILTEMGHAQLAETLPVLDRALQDEDPSVQSNAILELFELLQHHVEKLGGLLAMEPKKAKKDFHAQQQSVQQLAALVEKMMEHCHPDLQWTTLYKLLKLQLFTPEKIIAMMDTVMKKRIHHHEPTIEITRVLVELGKKYPKLAIPAFKQALETNNPEIHWAAMLELQALIKISPEIARYFELEKKP